MNFPQNILLLNAVYSYKSSATRNLSVEVKKNYIIFFDTHFLSSMLHLIFVFLPQQSSQSKPTPEPQPGPGGLTSQPSTASATPSNSPPSLDTKVLSTLSAS